MLQCTVRCLTPSTVAVMVCSRISRLLLLDICRAIFCTLLPYNCSYFCLRLLPCFLPASIFANIALPCLKAVPISLTVCFACSCFSNSCPPLPCSYFCNSVLVSFTFLLVSVTVYFAPTYAASCSPGRYRPIDAAVQRCTVHTTIQHMVSCTAQYKYCIR